MTCLRVYFEDVPAADESHPWCLLDAQGRMVREGRTRRSEWPSATEREAVLAALRGRVTVVTLPPLPAGRVESAARFALDDRLASPSDSSHIAVGAQARNGAVRCAIVDRAWLAAFTDASTRLRLQWTRIVLESDLAEPVAGAWRWCAPTLSDIGFVRIDDGSTIAISASADGGLPEELAIALANPGARRPQSVRVDVAGVGPTDLDRWHAAAKVPFIEGSAWTWTREPSTAAINLLQAPQRASVSRPRVLVALFRPAAVIAALALLLCFAGASGEWLWLHWESSRLDRDLASVASTVIPGQETADPASALASRYAELRHRAGLTVDSDLLPLLARAAPALAKLSAGTVRSVSYADRHLLLELQKMDSAEAAALQETLQRGGLVALVASTATGARMRIGTD